MQKNQIKQLAYLHCCPDTKVPLDMEGGLTHPPPGMLENAWVGGGSKENSRRFASKIGGGKWAPSGECPLCRPPTLGGGALPPKALTCNKGLCLTIPWLLQGGGDQSPSPHFPRRRRSPVPAPPGLHGRSWPTARCARTAPPRPSPGRGRGSARVRYKVGPPPVQGEGGDPPKQWCGLSDRLLTRHEAGSQKSSPPPKKSAQK